MKQKQIKQQNKRGTNACASRAHKQHRRQVLYHSHSNQGAELKENASWLCRKIFCLVLLSTSARAQGVYFRQRKSQPELQRPDPSQKQSRRKDKTIQIPSKILIPRHPCIVRVGVIQRLCLRTVCSSGRTAPAFED